MQVGKERKNTKWPRKNWLRWQWLLDLFQTDWFPITPSGPDFAAKPIETMNNYGQINLAGKFPILSKSTHIHYTLLFFIKWLEYSWIYYQLLGIMMRGAPISYFGKSWDSVPTRGVGWRGSFEILIFGSFKIVLSQAQDKQFTVGFFFHIFFGKYTGCPKKGPQIIKNI